MPTEPGPIVRALAASYPQLSLAARHRLATEMTRLIDAGLAGGWRLETIELYARDKNVSALAAKLRELRIQANMTQQDVGHAAEWSAAKVMRIEGGAGISRVDIEFLIRLYRVKDPKLATWLREQAALTQRRRPSQ